MMRELYRGEELEECKMWYQNGQLWQQTFYRDREPQGEYKSWHANGNPFMRGFIGMENWKETAKFGA